MPAARELNPHESLAAYFGSELRRIRELHHLTQDELRRRLRWSLATVASIETARRTPPDTFGERCDELFGLPGTFEHLADAVRAAQMWLADYKQYESTAQVIKIWSTLLVPGLFQTREYARAVLWAGRPIGRTDEELEADLAERMDRQKLLERPDPPEIWAVLHEAVVKQPTESIKATKAQLRKLLTLARRPNVTIQIVPFSAACHIGSDGPFTLYCGDDHPQIAFAEGRREIGRLIDQRNEVADVERTYDRLRAAALSPEASIGALIATMEAVWVDRI